MLMPKDSSFRSRPLAVFSVCTYLGSAVSSPCHSCIRAHTYAHVQTLAKSEYGRTAAPRYRYAVSHAHASHPGNSRHTYWHLSHCTHLDKRQQPSCSHNHALQLCVCCKSNQASTRPITRQGHSSVTPHCVPPPGNRARSTGSEAVSWRVTETARSGGIRADGCKTSALGA